MSKLNVAQSGAFLASNTWVPGWIPVGAEAFGLGFRWDFQWSPQGHLHTFGETLT